MLVLGACSGGDHDDPETEPGPYVEGLAQALSQDTTSAAPLDKAAATCTASAIVDTVGADTLDEAGIAPEDFEVAGDLTSLDLDIGGDATEELATALEDCELTSFLETQIVDQVATALGSDLPDEATTCLTDNIADTDLTATAARVFIDKSASHELEQIAIPAVNTCPEAFTDSIVESLAEQLDTDLTSDARTCLDDYITENYETVAASVLCSQNETAAEGINIGLATACPDLTDE